MKYLKFITMALFIFIGVPSFIKAQDITKAGIPLGDNVSFNNPEGYIDQQFKELAAKYIQPQAPGDLDEMLKKDGKVTPEILQRLIDMVSIKVSQQVRDDIITSLRETSHKNNIATLTKNNNKKRKTIIAGQKSSNNIDYDITPINNIEHKTKLLETLDMSRVSIPKFEIRAVSITGTKGSKVNINNASKKNVNIKLLHSKEVKKIRIGIIMKNIKTNQDILINTQTIKANSKGNTETNLSFVSTKLPMGNYKLIVNTTFLNAKNKMIGNDNSYWGNANTSEFVIMKN